LPPDLLAKARTRLAGLAGVLGALSLIALLLNATAFREEVDAAVQPQHVLAVGLALVVIVMARSKRIADATALTAGLVYEVCLCWVVSFAAQHAAIGLVGRAPELTWTSMIIVVFPMVIPLPPGRLLVASLLGAISSPVSLLVLDRMGKHALTMDELIGVSISPAFAVVLAYFGARMIYAIGLDVSRARLLGAYRLESRLGAGGMGEVWRASHRMLARPAAVKLIAPQQLGSGDGDASLAAYGGSLRFRAIERWFLLLRDGIARRSGSPETRRHTRTNPRIASGVHPAPGVPLLGGGPHSRHGSPRHQTGEYLRLPLRQ
jgi:serine/threonine-protein kinase